jgi:G:T-mismatch repair DNA endonuclease (very short patch repair protein)
VITVNNEKIKELEKKGWKVGTVSELLSLSCEEEEHMETKLALARLVSRVAEENQL